MVQIYSAMPFECSDTEIKEIKLIIPRKFEDSRGYFTETYKNSDFSEIGIKREFLQDNQSFSLKGTLRGLHFQNPPSAQGKVVRVLKGSILDVGVDIRRGSPSFGKYVMRELSDTNLKMLWIPEGFAHGFLALEDSIVLYKATSEYERSSEAGLIWNDKTVNIKWPELDVIISEKDQQFPDLEHVNSKFEYEVSK